MPNSYCEICGKRNPEDVVKFRIFEMGELSWIIPESPNCHHRAFVRRRHQGLEQEELVAMGRNQIAVEWKREGTQPWLWRWRKRLWTKKGEYYRFGLQESFGNCLFFLILQGCMKRFLDANFSSVKYTEKRSASAAVREHIFVALPTGRKLLLLQFE